MSLGHDKRRETRLTLDSVTLSWQRTSACRNATTRVWPERTSPRMREGPRFHVKRRTDDLVSSWFHVEHRNVSFAHLQFHVKQSDGASGVLQFR